MAVSLPTPPWPRNRLHPLTTPTSQSTLPAGQPVSGYHGHRLCEWPGHLHTVTGSVHCGAGNTIPLPSARLVLSAPHTHTHTHTHVHPCSWRLAWHRPTRQVRACTSSTIKPSREGCQRYRDKTHHPHLDRHALLFQDAKFSHLNIAI